MKNETKIIFFGTPEFAVPALKALYQEGFNICLVITQKSKPIGRKQIITPSPVKIEAKNLNLRLIEKLDLKVINSIEPDLGIVVAYGKIIPQNILDLFPKGVLNIHPSLLPKYRGPSPIQNAILNGDAETGISIIKLDKEMDHGPILIQEKYYLNQKENYPELSKKLSLLGAELLIKILPDFLENKIKPKPQEDSQATYIKILEKIDGMLDFNKSAIELERQIRAFAPWPGCFAEFIVKGKKINIKILTAHVDDNVEAQHVVPLLDGKPSVIGQFSIMNGQLYIYCSHGALLIDKLQPEGKKEMATKEFINGYFFPDTQKPKRCLPPNISLV